MRSLQQAISDHDYSISAIWARLNLMSNAGGQVVFTTGLAPDHNHAATSGDGGVLTGDVHDSFGEYAAISDPASPAASSARFYAKLSGGLAKLFYKQSDGTVIGPLAGAGSGAVASDVIWDAKGDLAAGTGADTASKLTVGADDTILMADAAAGTGLKWVASGTPSTQAIGDAAAVGTADTFTRGDHKHAMPSSTLSGLKEVRSVTVESPTNAEDIPIWITPFAITITKVYSFLRGGTSVTFNVAHGTNPASPTNLYTSDQTANTLTSVQTHSTTYADATCAIGEAIKFTSSAVSGTVIMAQFTIEYTRD